MAGRPMRPRAPTPARAAMVLALLMSQIAILVEVAGAPGSWPPWPLSWLPVPVASALLSRPGLTLGLLLMGLTGGAWAVGWRPRLSGGLALALVALGAGLEASTNPEHQIGHGRYLVFLAGAGWLLAGGESPGGAARAAAVTRGAVAAPYVLAGLAKILADGGAWLGGDALALVLVEHAEGPLAPLRLWVAQQPWLCALMGLTTVIVELAAPVMLLPRLRWPWVLTAAAMHLGIAALMGYVYADWVMILVAISGTRCLAPRA